MNERGVLSDRLSDSLFDEANKTAIVWIGHSIERMHA